MIFQEPATEPHHNNCLLKTLERQIKAGLFNMFKYQYEKFKVSYLLLHAHLSSQLNKARAVKA